MPHKYVMPHATIIQERELGVIFRPSSESLQGNRCSTIQKPPPLSNIPLFSLAHGVWESVFQSLLGTKLKKI